jgi:hypothetical protein
MSNQTLDDLDRILERHKDKLAAARAAALLKARTDADALHDCGPRLRAIAMPLLHDWSKRISVEGYPVTVDDRLGCRPPRLIFRLAPRGSPESSLTLACETDHSVRCLLTVAGKDAGTDFEASLDTLDTHVLAEGLGRFVAQALEATLPQSDCGPSR